MRLEEFDYDLPADRIAQVPIEPRDAARLLVDRGAAPPDHRTVRDLPDLLTPGDLLVVNETKVIPARLRLKRRTGGAAEVLLLEPTDGERRTWEALVRPARKLRAGEVLLAATGEEIVRLAERTAAGDTFTVELLGPIDALELLDKYGEMPLPPYITRRLDEQDRYQTVYATEPGSAAAPTAGLHFTPELLARLAASGIEHATVELVVGLDTFQPVSEPDPLEHRMHSERYRVPHATYERCRSARRVVAVGTTAVRALETAAATGRMSGRTELFIHRGFDWQLVDLMMTNFHLPRTTLLMMIDAFVGEQWRDLYRVALDDNYRFLSFGDAMLLELLPPIDLAVRDPVTRIGAMLTHLSISPRHVGVCRTRHGGDRTACPSAQDRLSPARRTARDVARSPVVSMAAALLPIGTSAGSSTLGGELPALDRATPS